jgi:hypothetical protein
MAQRTGNVSSVISVPLSTRKDAAAAGANESVLIALDGSDSPSTETFNQLRDLDSPSRRQVEDHILRLQRNLDRLLHGIQNKN